MTQKLELICLLTPFEELAVTIDTGPRDITYYIHNPTDAPYLERLLGPSRPRTFTVPNTRHPAGMLTIGVDRAPQETT